MVFFIPWRVVAEESGAAHLDLLGPPGWCSGCWPHDGDVAGGAGFLCSDIPVRGDDGARAIGATDDAAAADSRLRRRRILFDLPPAVAAAADLGGRHGQQADRKVRRSAAVTYEQ
jgi:hypothetical protein